MQLIEVSEIGVRAAIIRLVSPRSRLCWLLFPMLHLGERSYYAEVERRMSECDLVLAEGVESAIVSALTASYRGLAGSGGAVVQPELADGATTDVVNSDVSGAEFEESWRHVPLALRVAIPLLAPLYGAWLRYMASPTDWQKDLDTDDLPSDTDQFIEAEHPELFDLIVGRRNRHLFEQIDAVQERWADQERSAGIAWGAGHMGAVVQHLRSRWGYFAKSADWVTVFDYTKEQK